MTKTERREAMPIATSFVDDIREAFGEPAFIKATENGHAIQWGERQVPEFEGVPLTPTWRGE
jgi:hypothetical protein